MGGGWKEEFGCCGEKGFEYRVKFYICTYELALYYVMKEKTKISDTHLVQHMIGPSVCRVQLRTVWIVSLISGHFWWRADMMSFPPDFQGQPGRQWHCYVCARWYQCLYAGWVEGFSSYVLPYVKAQMIGDRIHEINLVTIRSVLYPYCMYVGTIPDFCLTYFILKVTKRYDTFNHVIGREALEGRERRK